MGVRTTYETAGILRNLNNEEFGGDEFEPYQIGWDQLRGIAGVKCAIYTPRRFYTNLQLAETTATLPISTMNCISLLYRGIHCLLAFKSGTSKYIQNISELEHPVTLFQSLARHV
jgi:hypothetical protein